MQSAEKDQRRTSSADEAHPGLRGYLRAAGPGLVTGASDDDPSGIATYAQAGARFQYGLLWASLVTLPLMGAVQEICDRTALATGRTLGDLAIRRFPRWRPGLWVLLTALLVANLLNITADVVAVGEGMHLLASGPRLRVGVLTGLIVTTMLIVGSFETIARLFKVLCLALLTYLVVMCAAGASWSSVVSHTVVPHVELTKEYMLLLVAVLGTTISPYLFFWQNAHRIEDLRNEPEGGDAPVPLHQRSSRAATRKKRTSRADVFAGMTFSNAVMFAIIVATGATIGAHGHTTITSAAQAPPRTPTGRGRALRDALCPRFHRLGNARDPGARRRRIGGTLRNAPQGLGLLALRPRSSGLLRPRPRRHARRNAPDAAGRRPDQVARLLRPHQRPFGRAVPGVGHDRLQRSRNDG